METKASVLIDRPIADVFEYLTAVERWPSWVSGVSAASYVGEGHREGSRIHASYNGGWRDIDIEFEVTRYDAPKSFGMKLVRGTFTFDGHFELEDEGGGTRVANFVEAGADSLGSEIAMVLAGPLVRWGMARRLKRELEALRDSIERD